MRKFLALVLALVMTMSLVTVSAGAATDFADDADITNVEAVEVLNAMGVLTGNNGKFNPAGKLTRGAGAKIIAYLMLGQEDADNLKATYTVFEDVTDGVGLAAYIEWAAANNIVGGYGDGKFGPYDTLTEYAFGKMLLAALGYDAKVQGYTGAGWQKNVYRDAVAAGIYDGTESYGACLRENAAAMALGALKANLVVYGDAELNGKFIVAGKVVETGVTVTTSGAHLLDDYCLYDLYEGLEYYEATTDVWGNPGDAWAYETFYGFYQYPTVAEYTTRVDTCDLLVDLGIPVNSKREATLTVYTDGVDNELALAAFGHAATHTACDDLFIGGQGVLTKVFALGGNNFIVTEVATHLGLVSDVVKTHAGTTATIDAEMSLLQSGGVLFGMDAAYNMHTDIATDTFTQDVVTTEFAKNDLVLLNIATADGDTFIVDAEVVTPVAGKLTGFVAEELAAPNASVTKVDGKRIGDAFGFLDDYAASKDEANVVAGNNSFLFVYDNYGNVIGMLDMPAAATTYLVIDSIWSETVRGKNTIAAEVVDWNADITEVNVTHFNGDAAALVEEDVINHNALEAANVALTNNLVVYTTNANGYALVEYTADELGAFERAVKDAKLDDGSDSIELTAKTKFLVRDVNGDYKAYTGYSKLPLMSATSAEYVLDDNGKAAYVYIDGAIYADSAVSAYIAKAEECGTELYNGVMFYEFKIFVDGVERYALMDDTSYTTITTDGAGLYAVKFNAVDGMLVADDVEQLTDTATDAVEIDYTGDIVGDMKIAFASGADEILPETVAVYFVDGVENTVEAATIEDLAAGLTVDVIRNTAGAIVAIYIILA